MNGSVGVGDTLRRLPLRYALASSCVLLAAAVIFYVLGGEAWVLQPGPWIGLGTIAAVLVGLWWIARSRRETLVIAAPTFVAGWLAVVAGAQDYGPWAKSPILWTGLVGSLAIGALFVRARRVGPPEILKGVLLGLVAFGVAFFTLLITITIAVFA